MKGIKLTDGDISITNNEIDMIEEGELTAQTISTVLATNKGEWLFDKNEGINFDNIFGKKQVKTNSATASYYQKELTGVKEEFSAYQESEAELAEKLRKRLDGE